MRKQCKLNSSINSVKEFVFLLENSISDFIYINSQNIMWYPLETLVQAGWYSHPGTWSFKNLQFFGDTCICESLLSSRSAALEGIFAKLTIFVF